MLSEAHRANTPLSSTFPSSLELGKAIASPRSFVSFVVVEKSVSMYHHPTISTLGTRAVIIHQVSFLDEESMQLHFLNGSGHIRTRGS